MQFLSKVLLFLAATSLHCAQASVSSAGTTLIIGGVPYFIPGSPVAKLSLAKASKALKSSSSLVPFTFISPSSGKFGSGDLSTVIAKNGASDDVWSTNFLKGMNDIAIVYVIGSD